MNKILMWLLAATLVLSFSCNSSADKTKKVKTEEKSEDDEPVETADDETDNLEKMASGICKCMGKAVDGLGDESKRILLKAGKSNNPTQTMQNEIAKIEDAEEKQRLSEEFTKLGNLAQDEGIKNCVEKLEKKYNVTDKDTKAQRRMIQLLQKDSDCSVVAALMNIGIKTQQTTDDE